MNLVSNYKEVKCPYCSYTWAFTGKSDRVECRRCKKWFRLRYQRVPQELQQLGYDNSRTAFDDMMEGNITEAFDKANIDPMNRKELVKDIIPIILKTDKLKFAFAEACADLNISPEKLLRIIVKKYLLERGYKVE